METQKYRVEIVPVDELKPLLKNVNDYKIHSTEKLIKLQNNIRKYGQLKPVILCKDIIVSGSKVLKASIDAGLEEVLVYILKDDLDEKARTFISLSLNELHFDTDYLKIAFQYNKIFDNATEAISLLPFTPHDMEKMQMIKDHDWDEFMNRGSNTDQIDLFEVADEETKKQQDEDITISNIDSSSNDDVSNSDDIATAPVSEDNGESDNNVSGAVDNDGGSDKKPVEIELPAPSSGTIEIKNNSDGAVIVKAPGKEKLIIESEEKETSADPIQDRLAANNGGTGGDELDDLKPIEKEESEISENPKAVSDEQFSDMLEKKKPIEEVPEPSDSDAPYHVGMKGTRTSRGKVMNVEITLIGEKAISYVDTDTEKKHKDEIHKFEKFFAPIPEDLDNPNTEGSEESADFFDSNENHENTEKLPKDNKASYKVEQPEGNEHTVEAKKVVTETKEAVTEPEKIETNEETTDNSKKETIENDDISALKNAAKQLKYKDEQINAYFDNHYDPLLKLSLNLKAFRDWVAAGGDKKVEAKNPEDLSTATKNAEGETMREVNGKEIPCRIPKIDDAKDAEAKKLQEELQQDVTDGLLDPDTAQDVMKATEKKPEPEAVKMDPFMKKPNTDVDLTIERKNEDFYINETRQLMIVNYQQEIVDNLPMLTKMILEKKYNQSDFAFERVQISKKPIEETKEIEVHHIIYLTQYGVKFNMILEELYDYLEKIDFEPQEEPSTLF